VLQEHGDDDQQQRYDANTYAYVRALGIFGYLFCPRGELRSGDWFPWLPAGHLSARNLVAAATSDRVCGSRMRARKR
jgi:hypothetical protein